MGWTTPTASGFVTSPYGPRKAVTTSQGVSSTNHIGTDYRAPLGSIVRAAGDGKVATVGNLPKSRGRYVVIHHADGTATLYQHLSTVTVSRGAHVTGGQTIGKAGATGNVTGAHLHFEAFTIAGGNRRDPVPYLRERMSAPQPAPVTTTPGTPASPSEGNLAACGGRLGSHVLAFGTKCPCVGELQRILNAWYPARKGRPALLVDDDYGTATKGRVTLLQQLAGIDVDGVAGPQVFGTLHVSV